MPLNLDFERVVRFVKARVPVDVCERMRAFGWERDGDLVAGVLVYGWTGPAAWIHVAGDGRRWLTRGFARVVCNYVFRDMGCDRLLATAEASNGDSLQFMTRFGFTNVARLEGAARDGGPMLINQLRRVDCKYVDR